MSKEIESAVAAILITAEVTFSALYAGETKNAFGTAGHTMDKWSCSLTKRDGRAAHEEFEYFTGIGQRETVRGFKAMAIKGAEVVRGHWQASKVKAPNVAGALHSLILDSSAGEQTFADWCSDFGYDTDSRKALNTYEACQENADKLRRVFTRAEIEALREALQDY